MTKGGEIRDTKTLNLSCTIVSLQVLVNVSHFHVAWSTWPATKTFVAGWRNVAHWLVDLSRQVVSLMKNEQQSQLYFSQQLSSNCNECFCCAQVDHARWKTGNINKNLQQNNVAWQIEGFCVSYFAALSQWKLLNCIKLLPMYPMEPFLIPLHMLYTLKNSYWK